MDATPIIIKKVKGHGHAHHGGSWKVAYADFVTAMMAFFMVMWIMGLSDDTRTKIQGYFNDPIGFAKNQSRAKTVISPPGSPKSKPGTGSAGAASQPYKDERKKMAELKKEVEAAMNSNPKLTKLLSHVKIQITEDGLRVEFLEDKSDFFESGSAVLTPGAVKLIQAIAPEIKASGRSMNIEGHTDSVPFAGDPFGNVVLSSARASALAQALGRAGVPIDKVLNATGFGDKKLRDPEHPTSSVNRRVTILLPFTTSKTATASMPKDDVKRTLEKATVSDVDVLPGTPDVIQGNN